MKKKTISYLLLVFLLSVGFPIFALAQDQTSTNFKVEDPVIDSGQSNSSGSNFQIGQSVNQPVIGKSSSSNFQLWSGFQYYYKVSSNTLSGTAGDGSVNLSWTVPETFLGINISSYDIGVGTTSGSYTYESAGAVTSYVKSGLTNGTTYYFIVRIKGDGGIVLGNSNEISIAPVASNTQGGGGATPGQNNQNSAMVIFQGLAAPNSEISVLQDLILVAKTFTNDLGQFQVIIENTSNGTSNFVLSYIDPVGIRSQPINFFAPENSSTTFANILLPPTLTSVQSEVKKGESLNTSGFTAPGAEIFIVVFPNLVTYTTTANTTGQFNLSIPTAGMEIGQYHLQATSNLPGTVSKKSSSLIFRIGENTIEREPTSACGDFNLDGRVNIIDFSILIYWYSRPNPPAKVDCNQDQKADIYDVSILMFNWTG